MFSNQDIDDRLSFSGIIRLKFYCISIMSLMAFLERVSPRMKKTPDKGLLQKQVDY